MTFLCSTEQAQRSQSAQATEGDGLCSVVIASLWQGAVATGGVSASTVVSNPATSRHYLAAVAIATGVASGCQSTWGAGRFSAVTSSGKAAIVKTGVVASEVLIAIGHAIIASVSNSTIMSGTTVAVATLAVTSVVGILRVRYVGISSRVGWGCLVGRGRVARNRWQLWTQGLGWIVWIVPVGRRRGPSDWLTIGIDRDYPTELVVFDRVLNVLLNSWLASNGLLRSVVAIDNRNLNVLVTLDVRRPGGVRVQHLASDLVNLYRPRPVRGLNVIVRDLITVWIGEVNRGGVGLAVGVLGWPLSTIWIGRVDRRPSLVLVVWPVFRGPVLNRDRVGLVNSWIVVEVLSRRWVLNTSNVITLIRQVRQSPTWVIVDWLTTITRDRIRCDWIATWVNIVDDNPFDISLWGRLRRTLWCRLWRTLWRRLWRTLWRRLRGTLRR